MKQIIHVILFLLIYTQAYSQTLSLKDYEKKLKELTPVQLKALMEENESLKAEKAASTNNQQDAQIKLSEKTEQYNKLWEEYENYKKSVSTATAPAKNEVDATLNNNDNKERLYRGVIFKVQIGAFRNKDLTKYFENNKNFSGEVEEGVKKYTLGYFNDYWEADNFKKYLREMGVKDAWIVPYKNGKRVNIRDVLEGLI